MGVIPRVQVLGLLAHHAISELLESESSNPIIVAGRQVSLRNRGRDLALVAKDSKLPTGMIPDFCHIKLSIEEWKSRQKALYGPLVTYNESVGEMFCFTPLHEVRLMEKS
jgi:hypothetical protein